MTRPGGYLTIGTFLDQADFVELSHAEVSDGMVRLVRRGFLKPIQVARGAFALTDAGAEAL